MIISSPIKYAPLPQSESGASSRVETDSSSPSSESYSPSAYEPSSTYKQESSSNPDPASSTKHRSSFLGFFEKSPDDLPPHAFFIDLDQYMGDWYVIACIPTPFETHATNAVESYRWNASGNHIDIVYHHNEGRPDGPIKSYPQKAWIADPESNAEWKVQFFWPLKFNYRVLDVASDYSWTVIGSDSKNFVWILARRTHLGDETYQMLREKLKGWGYDLSHLRKVPQVWDQVS